jgi:hypothetical protein
MIGPSLFYHYKVGSWHYFFMWFGWKKKVWASDIIVPQKWMENQDEFGNDLLRNAEKVING